MSKPFTFSIEGADKLISKLASANKDLAKKAETIIALNVKEMERNAVRAAQTAVSDQGTLAQGISSFKVGNLTFELVSNVHYSPYVEFGTGALVNVPAGLEDYAIQFKGRGIRQVNLPARPYFFPQFYKQKPILIEDLKQMLRDFVK